LFSQDELPTNYRIHLSQADVFHLSENSVDSYNMDGSTYLFVGMNGTRIDNGTQYVLSFYSTDGGHLWNPQTSEQSIVETNSKADPSVISSYFPYFYYLIPLQLYAYLDKSTNLKIRTSDNFGSNWWYNITVQESTDKPHLWKDDYNDHIFCAVNGPTIYESFYNYYQTWSKIYPVNDDDNSSADQQIGVNIKTDYLHNIYIIWTNQQGPWPVRFMIGTYTNGNYSWSSIQTLDYININPNPNHLQGFGVGFPVLAIDPITQHLFAFYSKMNSQGNIDVYIKKSPDGGCYWESASIVNTVQTGRQWLPWAAYNHGLLACIYYDGRDYPESGPYSTHVCYSFNEGNNWSDIKVSSSFFNLNQILGVGNDYLGITINDETDIIYPVWSDDRGTDGKYKAWCAPLTIKMEDKMKNNKNDSYNVFQNYPNPFNPKTNIKYEVKKPTFVSIKIYNVLGKEITTLVNEFKSAGTYTTIFEAEKFTSGTYFYRIIAGDYTETKLMTLIK